MNRAQSFFSELQLPTRDGYELLTSTKSFPDGTHYRIEIPSVEGPKVMQVVLEEAQRLGLTINRVSQGSGIMLLTNEEIQSMVQMGNAAGVEVCLFIGPRMSFDIGAMALSSNAKLLGWRHAGIDQLLYAMEDVYRAVDLGIRSLLIADEGLLWLIQQAKQKGDLPTDLVIKVSALLSPPNPISVRLFHELGATTVNVPGDLTLPRLSSIRQMNDCPIDLYIESPDDLGGFVRHYEIPEIVRIASPVYLKFGLRNAPSLYPSGQHLLGNAVLQGKERVRRAYLGWEKLQYQSETWMQTKPHTFDLGIPIISHQ